MKLHEAERFKREMVEVETEQWQANAGRWPCPWIWHELYGPWAVDHEPVSPLSAQGYSATGGSLLGRAVSGLHTGYLPLCVFTLPRVPIKRRAGTPRR